VVLTLEQVVIKEAQRSFTYFHLYGYPTDLVVANRILPDSVGQYFRGWYEAQQRYGPMVEQTFAPIPVRYAPFFDREVVGLPMLRELGKALYQETDPTGHYYRGRPYSVVRSDGEFVLSVELPFAAKEEIALSRHADEIVIDVGGLRRNLVLPRALIDAPTRGARFDDHVLKIRFTAPPRSTTRSTTRSTNGGGTHG
jgi:arsenite-transporting ATPase